MNFLGIRFDWWLHLMAGYIITMTSMLYFDYIISVYILNEVAHLKEYWDEFTGSSFDYGDINFTLIGGGLGYLMYFLAV